MNRFHDNRFLDAFLKMVLLLTLAHFVVLIVTAILFHDLTYLNIFFILGLSQYYPTIEEGTISAITSTVIFCLLYITVFLKYTKRK